MKCSVLQSNGIAYECIGTRLPGSWFIVLHVQQVFLCLLYAVRQVVIGVAFFGGG